MKQSYNQVILAFLFLILINTTGFAEKHENTQINLNLVDRLARIEEGQKAIISEIRTRFKSVDERFEAMQRELNSRFEAMQREMNSRFEAMQREMNTRFDAVDKRIDLQGSITIALFVSFLALIGYAIWDRRTAFEKYHEQFIQKEIAQTPIVAADQKSNNDYFSSVEERKNDQSLLINMQEKINQIIAVMEQMSKQSPEMRNMMNTAQLI
jgi:hypothetical protein